MAGKQGLKSTWKICEHPDCNEEFLALTKTLCPYHYHRRYIESTQYKNVEYGKKKNDK